MAIKRTRIQIIYDILKNIGEREGKIKPTQILYKSNLSHGMMKDYIKDILSIGLAKETHSKEGRTYSITEKGLKYISEYKTIINFMDSFGLVPNEKE